MPFPTLSSLSSLPTVPLPPFTRWGSISKRAKSQVHPKPTSLDLDSVGDGFGIPSVDDPDPFGVLALEDAGLEIKEAGTNSRPTSDTFEFKPSPTSPLFRHSFQSLDGSVRDSKRNSKRSMVSMDHGTQTAQMRSPTLSLQLEDPKPVFNSPTYNAPARRMGRQPSVAEESAEDLASIEEGTQTHSEEAVQDEEGEEEESDDEPEAIIEEASSAVQVIAVTVASHTAPRAKVVNIGRRAPPAVPLRSPLRRRMPSVVNAEVANDVLNVGYRDDDSSSVHSPSPTNTTFDRLGEYSPNPSSEQTSMPDVDSVRQKSDSGSQEIIPDTRKSMDSQPASTKTDSPAHQPRGQTIDQAERISVPTETPAETITTEVETETIAPESQDVPAVLDALSGAPLPEPVSEAEKVVLLDFSVMAAPREPESEIENESSQETIPPPDIAELVLPSEPVDEIQPADAIKSDETHEEIQEPKQQETTIQMNEHSHDGSSAEQVNTMQDEILAIASDASNEHSSEDLPEKEAQHMHHCSINGLAGDSNPGSHLDINRTIPLQRKTSRDSALEHASATSDYSDYGDVDKDAELFHSIPGSPTKASSSVSSQPDHLEAFKEIAI